MRKKTIITALVMSLSIVVAPAAMAGPPDNAGSPTCAGELDIANHGEHVIEDYVTNVDLSWPPAGQANAEGGATLPGGPGPGFHFPSDVAPGASFCNPQAKSPGSHIEE